MGAKAGSCYPRPMELFIARQAPSRTTRKADLLLACEASSIITPRPNWIHPSPREFLVQLKLLCSAFAFDVGEPLPHAYIPGARARYSTAKSWPIVDPATGDTRVLTWDSLSGDVHGDFRGGRWKEFALAVPAVIERAYHTATISELHVIDQIALAWMTSTPCAPFVESGLSGRLSKALWLAVPADHRISAHHFFETLGRPLLDGMVLSSGDASASVVTRSRIEASCKRGCLRLARSSGWPEICRKSHNGLLELISS